MSYTHMVSMKKILFSLLTFVGRCFSFIYPPRIANIFSNVRSSLYTGWSKRQFALFEGTLYGKIKVVGGKCISVHKGTQIYERVEFQAITSANGKVFCPEIEIGSNCLIQRDCQITSSNKVIIEDNVSIAARVLITDTVHGDFSPMSFTFENGSDIPDVFLQNAQTREYVSKGPVIIEHDVHIAMNCIVLPAVTLGGNTGQYWWYY